MAKRYVLDTTAVMVTYIYEVDVPDDSSNPGKDAMDAYMDDAKTYVGFTLGDNVDWAGGELDVAYTAPEPFYKD
jgi:hypothetical protein